ncbi:MAG TPA: GNAT family N-acetyltransferase [Micromonosporaceae bacterium]|jgi:GNAT superfamily N-acetyltransferase/DNA-binding transcriptional ArsR family regulator|nr:GNAT family N-acetyltransferase [Micromonosporaceae bacterium]
MSERTYFAPETVAVLRSPTRQHIWRMAQHPVTARQIAESLGVPVTRIYHHLERLTDSGLLQVVGQDKDGASVSHVYRASVTDIRATADLDQISQMLQDSVADVEAAAPGANTLIGKTIGVLPAPMFDHLVATVQRVIDDFDSTTYEDGDLVAFTYVVAPVRDAGACQIRPGTVDDLPTYRRILYEAVTWHPERSLPPQEQLLAHPELALFHEGWPRLGDIAVVAERAGEPVGGAFARLFTNDDHSSGYVDSATPELAIAVWPEHRGRGLGARLLAALADEARAAGFARLSLAVERDNPAAHLYQRCGYRVVGEPGDDYLMVLDLS